MWSSGIVAKVFSPNGVHIGRKLALAGVAYRLYWTDYVAAEARKARRGMWRGTFVKPWQWRITAPSRRSQAPFQPQAASESGLARAPEAGNRSR